LEGPVKVNARLHWRGNRIGIKSNELTVAVQKSPLTAMAQDLTEWAVIFFAFVVTSTTALNTVYTPTFGNFSQYLTLFIGAAGAGVGGNYFKDRSASITGSQRSAGPSVADNGNGQG
jgi:hypothetical protein